MGVGQNIDSLNLDIKITGLSDRNISQLTNLSLSLKSLDKAITPEFQNKINTLTKGLNGLSSIGNIGKAFKKFDANLASNLNIVTKELKKLDQVVTKDYIKRLNQLANLNFGFKNLTGLQTFLSDYKKTQEQLNEIKTEEIITKENEVVEETPNVELGLSSELESRKSLFGDFFKDVKEEFGKQFNLENLTKRFASILVYRGIRSVIKLVGDMFRAISNAFKEGIKNLAIFDKQANATMSRLTTATTQINNSIAIILEPMLNAVLPVVESVAIGFASIANSASEAFAQVKGLATYTKINAEYAKDYARSLQQASGFSFDTFNVLGNNNNVFGMFETGKVSEEMNSLGMSFVFIKDVISGVSSIITPLMGTLGTAFNLILSVVGEIWEVLKPIWDVLIYIVNDVLSRLGEVLKPFTTILVDVFDRFSVILLPIAELLANVFELFYSLLEPVLDIVQSVFDLISALETGDFDKFSKAFANIGISIINTLISIVNTGLKLVVNFFVNIGRAFAEIFNNYILDPIETILNGLIGTINAISEFFGGEQLLGYIEIQIDTSNWDNAVDNVGNIPQFELLEYAHGGVVENSYNAGSVFIAGEQGTEWVYDMGNGNTGVANVEQIEEAMINAIYRSGLIQAVEESGDLYIDSEKVGRKIGQTKSIRQQLNRTNPKLGLK